jgi:pantothenate synthetase
MRTSPRTHGKVSVKNKTSHPYFISDLERDMKLLEEGGAHVLFAPEGPDMYPPGYRTYVTLNDIEETLEGKSRPGFFRGTI